MIAAAVVANRHLAKNGSHHFSASVVGAAALPPLGLRRPTVVPLFVVRALHRLHNVPSLRHRGGGNRSG